jgi:hypothetical protein
LRFVFADPEQFREREIRERRIAGKLDDARKAKILRELFGLFFRALIAPDNGGTNDVSQTVEENGSMHLSREANRGYVLGCGICVMKRFLYGRCARTPPIERVLLGPTAPRRSERLMLVRAGRGNSPLPVHEQGACAARSHVNP